MKATSGRLLTRLGLVTISVLMIAVFLRPASAQLPVLPGLSASAPHLTFGPGDVFVSTENGGPPEWWNADGTFHSVLASVLPGSSAEGMRFDAAGNLYLTHWWPTQAIEVFNNSGLTQGTFGSGYNCQPHAIAFDAAGNAYVGQAACTGAVLKFPPGGGPPIAAYFVTPENFGSFWVELAADGCTLFYTSAGPNVKRFNVCTNAQLSDFNQAPVPGGVAHGLRLLPDGGVLVSTGAVISRLDASGALVQTYSAPTSDVQFWAGLDLVGDGTFWATNYYAFYAYWGTRPNVYKFDLATGAALASFNTGTPVVDVVVSR